MSTSPTDASRVHATFETHIGSISSYNFPLNEKITWLKNENMMGPLDILEHFVLLREWDIEEEYWALGTLDDTER